MTMLLEGLKVIDAASFVAGPAAATVMADFGADVIKVEPPEGESYRYLAARYRTNYFWQLTSRNKRGLALDLRTEAGQEVIHRLVDDADVLLVNFNEKQLRNYRLDYDYLQSRNPRLIFAHMTGYGSRGPDRAKRAFDLAAWWARTGIMDMMKPKDGHPVNGVGGVGDHASAMSLFAAIMLGLYHRERTGQGRYVSSSLAANGVWANGMQLQSTIAGNDVATALKEKGQVSPFTGAFESRDGRYVVLVGAVPEREWPRLCRALERTEWLADERFADMAGIMSHREEVKGMFAREFSRLKLDDIVRRLDAEDATYSVLAENREVIEDAQLIENEYLVRTASANPDFQWTISSPIAVAGASKRVPGDPPEVGQNSVAILRELGYEDTDIEQLLANRVTKQFI
ncbi:MAG: CoA transferase [Pseudomonadales bacterium]|nr:CoA transferase [Pseudomonadales bacterium]